MNAKNSIYTGRGNREKCRVSPDPFGPTKNLFAEPSIEELEIVVNDGVIPALNLYTTVNKI